jgi:hypothetical protein
MADTIPERTDVLDVMGKPREVPDAAEAAREVLARLSGERTGMSGGSVARYPLVPVLS